MALELALSGSTTYIALEESLSLVIVVTVAGVYTTVDIRRTFPLRAMVACLQTVIDYLLSYASRLPCIIVINSLPDFMCYLEKLLLKSCIFHYLFTIRRQLLCIYYRVMFSILVTFNVGSFLFVVSQKTTHLSD